MGGASGYLHRFYSTHASELSEASKPQCRMESNGHHSVTDRGPLTLSNVTGPNQTGRLPSEGPERNLSTDLLCAKTLLATPTHHFGSTYHCAPKATTVEFSAEATSLIES